MSFQIEFYADRDGKEPVKEFLDSLDAKTAAKVLGLMDVLEMYGNELREPYSKHLDDGIFELRCKRGRLSTRILYFFFFRERIVMTNGFVKKTPKTPPEELLLAKKRRSVWIEQNGETER